MNSASTKAFDQLFSAAKSLGLPRDFVLGAATAAYQVEGAVDIDGKGKSIWDCFTHRPGAIRDAATGDVACDHYNRWQEDLNIMRQMNLDAYRFSVSWSRILPEGRGAANRAGLDFYDRIVDALLSADIVPFVTLYHWDLPQALQDEGEGWLRRSIADDFVHYADVVTRRLGDRVRYWTTFNEPWTFTWWGYAFGEDAPGLVLGARGALQAGHHALLAHGKAVHIIRANARGAKVGIVLDLNTVAPASDLPQDIAAARRFDGCQNRWYLDALFRGRYPDDMLSLYGALAPTLAADDLATICAPIDYLGINVYRRSIMADGMDIPPINCRRVLPPGQYTGIGWEVHPECLFDVVSYVHSEYAPNELYITENGAAYPDTIDPNGEIWDLERSEYLLAHLKQVRRVLDAGLPLKGYFAWTLIDNFEWAYGFSQRFGLVHVDFASQGRRLKASAKLFALACRNRD